MKSYISRRAFLKATAGLAVAGALSACSSDSSSSSTTSQAASSATASGDAVTVKYWTTNRADQAYMEPVIADWNNSHDDIKIDYEIYSDNFSQMLDLAFSTGEAPDMFMLSSTVEDAVNRGYAHELDSLMSPEFKAQFGDDAWVEGTNQYNGVTYSVPFTSSSVRLFYNQSIFDRVGIAAPPTSLDELIEDTRLITEQLSGEGIYGFAANYNTPASSVTRTIDMVVQRSGGTCYGFDFSTGRFDFSSYKPVLEGFKEIFAGGLAFPGCESLDIDPLRSSFAAGKIGMYMSVSHAEPGVYMSQFPTEENWSCAPIPSVTGEILGKQNYWFGGSNVAISATTEHLEETMQVYEYIHSIDVMTGYYENGLGLVMIPEVIENGTAPEIYATMPNLLPDENDASWPARPSGYSIEGEDYYTVCVKAIFGVTDVDDAIAELNDRYNTAYDKLVAEGTERIVYPNFDPLGQDTSI